MAAGTGKHRILVVDDDPDIRKLLLLRLRGAGYEVVEAESGEQALGILPGFHPQLVITDMRMDGMDGMALFDEINQQNPTLPVIMLTAHGNIEDAVDATQRGLFSYLPKPFEGGKLLATIEKALQFSPANNPADNKAGNKSWRSDIVSRSRSMEDLLSQVERVANTDVSILIQSESGTGKELLARAIHRASPRSANPFVALNCSAIPEQLLESELFGHVKGAFTGASANRVGLFQEAEGGTLFLDEIGDMPMPFQSKLLRALQENEIRPVGANHSVAIDVRVISATHQDLESATKSGKFREDLFYRLNVIMLELAPLRDRREDIPLLISHFLERLAKKGVVNGKKFAPEALEVLMAAPWPGNVRQLQNVVEQTAILATSTIIPVSLVRKALRHETVPLLTFAEARDAFEREYLIRLLQMTEGNVSQAARLADKNRTELYKLFTRHALVPELFRQSSGDADL